MNQHHLWVYPGSHVSHVFVNDVPTVEATMHDWGAMTVQTSYGAYQPKPVFAQVVCRWPVDGEPSVKLVVGGVSTDIEVKPYVPVYKPKESVA